MWQEVVAGFIVALAVAYLAHKVFGIGKRRRRRGDRKPDVPVSRLTRKDDR